MGGSQIGRIREEIRKIEKGKERVQIDGFIKTFGMMNVAKITLALRELKRDGKEYDKIVMSGPGNCLVEHGVGESRGFKPERKVKEVRDMTKGRQEWEVTYHMSEPKKLQCANGGEWWTK